MFTTRAGYFLLLTVFLEPKLMLGFEEVYNNKNNNSNKF